MIKVVSLFSGVGGMDYGFHHSPFFEIVFANDFDKNASETYVANFKGSESYFKQGDIKQLLKNIPQHDLVLGGFPCPSWSLAGKRKGFEDDRGLEFYTCTKVLEKHQPKYFIFENVKGLLSHDNGLSLKVMLGTLVQQGYNVRYKLIKMTDYGVPQRRERVIFFGIRQDIDLNILKFMEIPTSKCTLTVEDVLKKYPDASKMDNGMLNHNDHIGNGKTKLHWIRVLKDGENLKNLTEEEITIRETTLGLEHKRPIPKSFMGYRRLNSKEIAPTMMFGNTCLPIHPFHDRSISVREAAAFQTFPDDFEFKGGIAAQYKQVGNAVPVNFSILLANHLEKVLK